MFKLKNLMEEIVAERIEEIMPNMNCCTCEQCKLDVMAYALNRLPPKYVSSEEGLLFSKLETNDAQIDMLVTTTVTKAIKLISSRPHHSKKHDFY